MTPILSVVTVVRNAAATIGDSVDSIALQEIPAQHLVVDGQSTDETLAVLKARRRTGLSVSSEPDQGIYDAMSKGIRRGTGEVIGVLNADDIYAGERILTDVAEVFRDLAVDACYGDLDYVQVPGTKDQVQSGQLEARNGEFRLPGEKVIRRWRAGKARPESFYWGWMPPHPTFFVRKSVYERLGLFRLDLGTSADYELMLRFMLKHRINVRYIPKVLVKMRVGGASNASWRNRLAAHRNDYKAWKVNGLRPCPWTLLLKPLRKIGQWL